MAIITPALINALFTGFKKVFDTQYARTEAASYYRDLATVVKSGTAKETYGWLTDFPDLVEWIGARTLKDMQVLGYEIVNRHFEGSVAVNADHIADDTLGQYGPRFARMAEAAARHPDQLLTALIKAADATTCYDGQFFFDTDHPVYPNHDGTGAATSVSNIQAGAGPKWFLFNTTGVLKPFIFQSRQAPRLIMKENPRGSDHVFMNNEFVFGVDYRANVGFGFWQQAFQSQAALDSANLDAAIQTMMEFQADGGRPLGIMPNVLYVPPALRADANATVLVERLASGASNPNYKAVEVKVVPWLA